MISRREGERRTRSYHCDRRLDSQTLLDDGAEVRHIVDVLERNRLCDVIATDAHLLLSDLVHNLRVVGQVLEHVDHTRAHGVLTGEEEAEDDESHFVIIKLAWEFTSIHHGLFLCVLDILDPLIQHALHLAAVGNVFLAQLCRRFEMGEGDLSGLDGAPDFGAREGEREVDQFECERDFPIIVADDGDGGFGDMFSAKDAERGVHVEIADGMHDRLGLVLDLFRRLEPERKVVASNGVLGFEIDCECFAGEETVEGATVVDVGLAV